MTEEASKGEVPSNRTQSRPSNERLDPNNMIEDSIMWSRAGYPLTAVSRYRDAAHEIAALRREVKHLTDMLGTVRPAPETLPGHDPRVICPDEANVRIIDAALGRGWVAELAQHVGKSPRRMTDAEADAVDRASEKANEPRDLGEQLEQFFEDTK